MCRQGQDVAPARVIVFCADEDAAKRAAMPLRSGLWGDHIVSVLLPHGEEPIQVTSPSHWHPCLLGLLGLLRVDEAAAAAGCGLSNAH